MLAKAYLNYYRESPINPIPNSLTPTGDESEVLKLRILNNKICSKEFHENGKT